jgi:MoxR-like ATPase
MYEQGGVFLLDELDAADANVMVAINAALANGVLANPVTGKVHKRHEKFYVLAAANTWGRGGDHMYVGRNQLDAATLDRFILSTLHVDYDGDLERDLARAALPEEQAEELLGWVTGLRSSITRNRLRRVASTRLVLNGARAMKAGKCLDDVKNRFFVDWSADEKSKVQA